MNKFKKLVEGYSQYSDSTELQHVSLERAIMMFLAIGGNPNGTLENSINSILSEYETEFLMEFLDQSDNLEEWDIRVYLETVFNQNVPQDVLPVCRRYSKLFEEDMNSIIEMDIAPEVFNGGFKGLRAIGYNLDDDGSIVPPFMEYDEVLFIYETSKDGVKFGSTLSKMISIILLSDCPGCCDAIDFIKLSSNGLIAKGDISMTYHS